MAITRNSPRSWWGPRRFGGRKQSDTPVDPTDPDELNPPAGYMVVSEDGFVLTEDGYVLIEAI